MCSYFIVHLHATFTAPPTHLRGWQKRNQPQRHFIKPVCTYQHASKPFASSSRRANFQLTQAPKRIVWPPPARLLCHSAKFRHNWIDLRRSLSVYLYVDGCITTWRSELADALYKGAQSCGVVVETVYKWCRQHICLCLFLFFHFIISVSFLSADEYCLSCLVKQNTDPYKQYVWFMYINRTHFQRCERTQTRRTSSKKRPNNASHHPPLIKSLRVAA